MPSTCPHCGIGFNQWQDYQEHLTSSHRHKALESNAKALARHHRSTSGRSKAQIVAEAESTWLAPFIVTSSNEQEHLPICRCHACWLKLANSIIKTQEELL